MISNYDLRECRVILRDCKLKTDQMVTSAVDNDVIFLKYVPPPSTNDFHSENISTIDNKLSQSAISNDIDSIIYDDTAETISFSNELHISIETSQFLPKSASTPKNF